MAAIKGAEKAFDKQAHSIKLDNRSSMTVTGVNDVINFSDSSVELMTTRGAMTVRGKNLNMSKLNTDTGELSVNGEINMLQYSNKKKKGSVLEGLFK